MDQKAEGSSVGRSPPTRTTSESHTMDIQSSPSAKSKHRKSPLEPIFPKRTSSRRAVQADPPPPSIPHSPATNNASDAERQQRRQSPPRQAQQSPLPPSVAPQTPTSFNAAAAAAAAESRAATDNQEHAAQQMAWNPSHPCFPHPNPHVPLSSPLAKSTRIIRIPRDWMVAGDDYPAFSNTYPEILAPWISEADFRRLVERINRACRSAFDPHGPRAWIDTVLGALTGWLYEDIGWHKSKAGMREIERAVDEWNVERRKDQHVNPSSSGNNEGSRDPDEGDVVRAISLRRTAFLSLDFVIPDPKIAVVRTENQRGPETGNALATDAGPQAGTSSRPTETPQNAELNRSPGTANGPPHTP